MNKTLLVLSCIIASACSKSDGLMKKIATPEAESFGREFIQILARGDIAMALSQLEPQLRGPNTDSGVAHIISAIQGRPVTNLKLVGVQRSKTAAGDVVSMDFEGAVADSSSLIASVVLADARPSFVVTSAHVLMQSKDEAEANRFTWNGRGIPQYVIFVFGALVVLFVMYTLVQIVRTKPHRKWLWFVFALLPIGSVSVNWATGELGFRALSILLLGMGVMKTRSYGPWVVEAGLPIGAVLFQIRRTRSKLSSRSETGESVESDRERFPAHN
jgi:hypothetical protein